MHAFANFAAATELHATLCAAQHGFHNCSLLRTPLLYWRCRLYYIAVKKTNNNNNNNKTKNKKQKKTPLLEV